MGAIDCKKNNNCWEVLTENGRESTNLDAYEWAKELQELGIGELLLTSVDMEGTKKDSIRRLQKKYLKISKYL